MLRNLTLVVKVGTTVRCLEVVNLIKLGLGHGIDILVRRVVLPQIIHHLAVVLVVGKLDVFEQESGHWELKLVRLLQLLFDLMGEFGEGLASCFRTLLIDISEPLLLSVDGRRDCIAVDSV